MAELSNEIEPDPQAGAEVFDEEALGGDEVSPVHRELLGPDLGGADDVAELVGSFDEAEGPLGPEDAAMHVEDERARPR